MSANILKLTHIQDIESIEVGERHVYESTVI
jgi:hypothetical protein